MMMLRGHNNEVSPLIEVIVIITGRLLLEQCTGLAKFELGLGRTRAIGLEP